MKLGELAKQLDNLLEPSLAYSWDNVGLTVGRREQKISKVLLTLEVTMAVIEEAKAKRADLIVSHHPFLFRGLKSVVDMEEKGRQVYELIKNDIAVYSCHTNYDIIEGGLNDYAAGLLGLQKVQRLTCPESEDRGIGRYGELETEMCPKDFADYVREKLGVPHLRMICGHDRKIKKVGLVTGAGIEFLAASIDKDCDAFLTGDIKYHEAQDALQAGYVVLDAGHYGTEIIFNQSMREFLGRKLDVSLEYIESETLQDPFVFVSN